MKKIRKADCQRPREPARNRGQDVKMVNRLFFLSCLILTLTAGLLWGAPFCSMEEELTLSFTPAQSGLIRNGITSPSTLSRASVPVFDGIFKDLDLRDRENRPVTGSKYKVSLDIYDLKSEINSLKKQLRITFIQENEVEGRNLHLYWQKTEGKPCQIATPLPRFNAPKSCLSLIRKEEKLKEINETSHQTEVGGVPSLAGMLLFSLFKLPSKEEPRFHFRIKRE